MKLAASDCAFDQGTGGTVVGVEVAVGEGILAGLDVHVEAAGGGDGDDY